MFLDNDDATANCPFFWSSFQNGLLQAHLELKGKSAYGSVLAAM